MKDKLDEKITTKFLGLRWKTYSYLIDNGSEDEKGKSTKESAIKRKLKFEDHRNCLEAIQLDDALKVKIIKNSEKTINLY